LAEYVSVGARTTLSTWGNKTGILLTIGEHVHIGTDCHITAANHIQIGNGVLLGKMVTISDNSHGDYSDPHIMIPPIERPIVSKGGVKISDKVWIGDKATILSNVTIGEGAIIGANSVVTHDVPAYCVAAGNPAKVIKQIKNHA